MKNLLQILILFFSLLIGCAAFGQQDSVQQKKDSVLDAQQRRIRQLSAERLADSLKRAELEHRISLISSNDDAKKVQLEKELTLLKQSDSLRAEKQKHQVDSLRKSVKGFPIVPFRDTLFYLFTRQGSFTAKERAETITARIAKLAEVYGFKADSLTIVPAEQTTDIIFRDQLLISISAQDAIWQNTDQAKLAKAVRDDIAKAVIKHQEETKWQTLVEEALYAVLVISVVILLIYLVNRLFRIIVARTRKPDSWWSSGLQIRNYKLLSADQQAYVLRSAIGLVKLFFIILIIYLALPVLFGIFPYTRDISSRLLNYFLSPVKKIGAAVGNYIPNLITIIVLVVIFRYILKLFRYIKTEIEKEELKIPGFYPDWANPTYQIIRVLILAFLLIVIFPYLPGSDSEVFKGVSVFMGVLFTFGSAGALSNVVAGLVMTYMRAFKIGDRVKIGDVTGDIIEKTILVTRVRTIQNEIISIPNAKVMGDHTTNYSSEATTSGLIIHAAVTFGYDVPWRQVHQLLIDAALATPMIEHTPSPYVLQTGLDDHYVSYRINAFTKQANKQARIYSDLYANIQDLSNKAGIEIMSPHYHAIRDGNQTTIPPEYLPKDYKTPAFRTQQPDTDSN